MRDFVNFVQEEKGLGKSKACSERIHQFIYKLGTAMEDESDDENNVEEDYVWVDPVMEIENDNHSHSDLLAHRLFTPNAKLIDYHNLNCDGNVIPPAGYDNMQGRECFDEFKNTAPTPGDNSEIAIEGNFEDDWEIYGDGTGGCYAYVSSYNQFVILDISNPNNIRLLSTYYAEVARMIDIKVTEDNIWVLVNQELKITNLMKIFRIATVILISFIFLIGIKTYRNFNIYRDL